MLRRKVTRSHETGHWVIAAVFLALCFSACSSGNKQLSRTDVQLAAGDLRTFGAATKMLLDACSSGDATATFCRAQGELLGDDIDSELKGIDGNAADANYERAQLVDIGGHLREIARRIEQGSSMSNDATDADRISSIAKTVEDTLRK
ncbi:MAG TPA: hypothetical protein VL501_08140 [Pyrinomonadaceae bacterium]|nr:hypothetical protein [Pyrinomonadaceae bacterium]